jgi:hypothetical protein
VQQQVVQRRRPVLAQERGDGAEVVRGDADRDALVDLEAGMQVAGAEQHRDHGGEQERAGDGHARSVPPPRAPGRGGLTGANTS